jgi:PKHD-type hydroxylase
VLIEIPDVLNQQQLADARALLLNAQWSDGRITAGYQSARAKNNLQLAEDSDECRQIGATILKSLASNGLFYSAALPARIYPPLFNCYQGGRSFDVHIDNAIRFVPGTPVKVRTDLSMTLFLSEPDEYEGGELIIEDTFGSHRVKLKAGHMIVYPGTSLHRVTPVTGGRRLASFFWAQSMVASDERRRLLFELDTAIQNLNSAIDGSPELIRLTGIYHNLLRQWGETG